MAFDFPNNPSSGDVVTIGLKQWTFLTGKWLANGISGGGGGASALDDLTDVTITAVSNGQVLKYNGSAWVNAADNTGTTISSIDDITDVTITSASTGQFLKWNGTAWVNDTIDLGTDTSGSFIASLVAGTGVTLTNNSGEAATPTVAVDTAVIAPLASPTFTGTVSGITKSMVGLGSVDNTADTAKPISTAQQTALDLKANLASPTFTGTVSGISATMVGLGNVTNTSDANKPVSTAQQNALDLKSNLASPTFTGTVTTNDLTVSGNLTVSGTTTSINTETLTVDDNIIVLNNNATGAPSQDAGIEVERGSSTNVQLRWNETNDKWQFTNDGTNYTDLGAGGATVSNTSPTGPISGQIWFNSLTGGTFVYYGTNWIEIGASPFSALINTINAKGNLLVGTADNTIGGLTAGSNNQVLTVDSTTATGLKWSTPTEYATTGKAIAMAIVFGG